MKKYSVLAFLSAFLLIVTCSCDDDNDTSCTESVWFADADSDGLGDPNVTQEACEQPQGFVDNSNDNNDDLPCDEALTFYADIDADGKGDANNTVEACEAPVGFVDNADDPDDSNPEITFYPAMEIAVREVNEGGRLAFETARSAFIPLWTGQPNAIADREFHSFFNIPANVNDVFVGMTSWVELADFFNASNTVGSTAEAGAFFASFDMKAFVTVQQSEGPYFNL